MGTWSPQSPSQTFISDPLHPWIWHGHLALPHQEAGKGQKACKADFPTESRPREWQQAWNQDWCQEVEGSDWAAMNAWMGTLCPGPCVAAPHHQLCAAPPAGERVDACAGQSSSCSAKLDCHALLDFLFSTRSKAIIRTFFFFFFGKVIRVLFYTALKKYNFLLFELKVTTQHFKPTLSSTYSKVMA